MSVRERERERVVKTLHDVAQRECVWARVLSPPLQRAPVMAKENQRDPGLPVKAPNTVCPSSTRKMLGEWGVAGAGRNAKKPFDVFYKTMSWSCSAEWKNDAT